MLNMNTRHTQGPWSVSELPDQGIYCIHAAAYSSAFAVVQSVSNANKAMGSVETHANAALISAAPELLEALKGLDEAYCRAGADLTRDERHEDRLRLIAARAAIAKATGS